MSYIVDLGKQVIGSVTGSTAADASVDSAQIQADSGQLAIDEIQRATAEGQSFLQPFQQIGQEGLDQSSFLTNPEEQFNFLQNNPLFQMGLDNANTVTQKSAAARGRLTAGDTLERLTNNSLLAAAPLISDQKNSIQNLLSQGLQTAQGQGNIAIGQGTNVANTTTDIGAALAAGRVGAGNAESQGGQDIMKLGSQIAGFITSPSDPMLKENVELIGNKNGFNIYKWDWNETANKELGLNGSSEGVMADQVKNIMPEAVQYKDGFMHVDYNMIGVH
jgi:hypothetical protein